jgi:uncharacterized BrkB/YihY/UPF0761 family membrane protein
MSLEGLSGLVNRIIVWADRLQRKHGVLGFPYAVVKKYGDDEGGRQAVLITYYGFLSIFPLLLLGVAALSRVLADHPDLRQRLITAIVPKALRSTVESSLATLPTSAIPFVVGLAGLLLSGTGVVFSAYQTLNHVAAVRYRFRGGFVSRYVRVFVVLARLLAGAVATGALTVAATALPGQRGVQRAAAVPGSALVVFAVLLFGAKLLLARPAPIRALWPGALIGAAAVTVVLNADAPLLARLVTKAGPVYGSFATVAGMFALLYLVGQALVYARWQPSAMSGCGHAPWTRAAQLRPMPGRWPCWPASRNGSPPPALRPTSRHGPPRRYRVVPHQPTILRGDQAAPATSRPAPCRTGPAPRSRSARAKAQTTSSQALQLSPRSSYPAPRISFQHARGFLPAHPSRVRRHSRRQASDRYPYRFARPPRRLGSVLIAGQLYTVTNPRPFILFITLHIVRLCTGVYRLLKTAKSTRSTRTPAAMNRM